MIPPERCQRQNWLADHSARRRLARNVEGLRSTLRWLVRAEWRRRAAGEPSCFAPGSWVRVRDADAVRGTLDSRARLRGLWFADQQWGYCGRTLRVLRSVRRILDDNGYPRPVSRTVVLEGASCGGPDTSAGCGRDCPLFFRDEWLEEASPPPPPQSEEALAQLATVRSIEEIERTLDVRGRRGRLTFMREMAAFAGQSFRVERRLEWLYEDDRFAPAPEPVYILKGLRCAGTPLDKGGPCDRACALLWHADWLRLRSSAASPDGPAGEPTRRPVSVPRSPSASRGACRP